MDNNIKWLKTLPQQMIEPQAYSKIEDPSGEMPDGDECYLCQAERIQILKSIAVITKSDSR